MISETLLQLSLGKLPLQSGRGIKHTLVPQSSNLPLRTLSGELTNSNTHAFHKYRVILEGTDIHVPPFEELLIGLEVRVGLVNQFCRFVSHCEPEQVIKLSRLPQEDSVFCKTIDGEQLEAFRLEADSLSYTGEAPIDDLVIAYRPWLLTRVVDFSLSTDERENKSTWRLVCDEI